MTFAQNTAEAQQTLGVVWEPPANESEAIAELQQFHNIGVSVLELQAVPADPVWATIEERDFKVYGNVGLTFPTTSTFRHADSTFSEQLRQKVSAFANQPSVEAIQLFSFGAIRQADFRKQADSFFNSLVPLSNLDTYYVDNRIQADLPTNFLIYHIAPSPKNVDSLSIPRQELIGGFLYAPSGELKNRLTPFKQIVQQVAEQPEKPLFLEGEWLLSMMGSYPELKKTLQALTTDSNFSFPVPAESLPADNSSSLPAIILLFVWATLGYHYHMSPLYRKSLFRYFAGHTFFVNDIFRRHIRSPIPAIVIIGQHALLTSAALFAVCDRLWSPLGQQVLYNHFSALFIFGEHSYTFFILALAGTLAFSILSVLWLHLAHRSLGSITQTMTLYAWPLQLNFIFATIVIALYVSGGSILTILFFTTLMILVLGISFMITSWDISQLPSAKKINYLGLTTGLFLLALLTLFIWMVGFNHSFWEAINLSLELK